MLADGVKGTDYDLIPMRGGKFLRSTKVGRALSDADCIVTLSRAALDQETGYRGVLHAVGFGCGARPGKVDMLTTGQPVVDPDKCIGCGKCTGVCEHGGTRIDPETGKAFIFKLRCAGCSRCMRVCPVDAIHPDYNATDERVRMKIAEVGKEHVRPPHLSASRPRGRRAAGGRRSHRARRRLRRSAGRGRGASHFDRPRRRDGARDKGLYLRAHLNVCHP